MEAAGSASGAVEVSGRYTLDRQIGRGGMGAVWLATDRVLGRTVALKRLGFAPGAAAPDVLRAEREARLAARLQHPHVVAVFDVAEDRGEHWLVMEYVDGQTLGELVRSGGPLPPDRTAAILSQAAEGLAAAHAVGIVHRDVKPSNILLSRDGVAKISDFGIARGDQDSSLTSTNLVTGSPAYLAPEVASGRTATPAADVWALGATAFHALTGRPPYDVGDNILGALYRIVHEAPPRPEQAGWLAPLLEHTMDRDAGRRWTMAQVRAFLVAGPGGQESGPTPATEKTPEHASGTQELAPVVAPRRRWVGPLAGALAGLAVVVVFGLVAWMFGAFDATPSSGDPDGSGTSGAPTTGESTPSPSPSDTAGEAAAREAAMVTFVRDYLATVARDPAEGWLMLTPEFQEASGGFEKYREFWDPVEAATVESISADPESLTVSYRVTYQRDNQGAGKGGRSTDNVTLLLSVQGDEGDSFLIAAEK